MQPSRYVQTQRVAADENFSGVSIIPKARWGVTSHMLRTLRADDAKPAPQR